MDILLDGPQRFDNLCAVVRTLEVFGLQRCFVYDPTRLVRERYGRRRQREARGISAGAFSRVALIRVEDPVAWLADQPGRAVATVLAADATPLPDFAFRPDDIIVFGSESGGVSEAVQQAAPARITIPQSGQTQSLNLAVAVGVVVYAARLRSSPPALR